MTEPRRVSESQATVSQVMMPNDANNLGNVFGGVILSVVDHVAGVSAIRHARQPCVTVSMEMTNTAIPRQPADFNSR